MNALSTTLAGGIALVFTALMMFQRSLYASALCLLAVLLQTAVLFYLSGSPLLAFLQVMIYAGAVMVLVVVAIMATPSALDKLWSRLSVPWPAAILGLALLLAELAALLLGRSGAAAQAPAPPVQALGSILFGPYAVATEAVTVLMLLSALAIVGRRGPGGAG
jgi:NADH:ubiquinone oxidoreductase subunit 6 (subunit J)